MTRKQPLILRLLIATALNLGALTASNAVAQSPVPLNPIDASLTAAARDEVIDDIASQLSAKYVDEETGRRIGELITAKNKGGGYGTLTNKAQFAETLTHDLRMINGDLHLSLKATPHVDDAGPAPAKGNDGKHLPSDEKDAVNAALLQARRDNFGLGRAEILDGNIGYLEIRSFQANTGYEQAVASALHFLEYTDAVIIDLRRNHGGDGEMSNLVYSHFFGDKPIPTINFVSRDSKGPQSMFTTEKVPGPRRPDVPLYVLTSQDTASAAEEFSSVVQNRHRATLIGSRTAGAGHMVEIVPVVHGFALSVSITRVTDPFTGKEWEGTGVRPDLATRPEDALTVAHAEAVRHVLLETTDTTTRQDLTRLLVTLDAKRSFPKDDPAVLAGYIGIYHGREITLHGNRLSFCHVGGQPEELTSLGNGRFALRSVQFSFEKSSGKAIMKIDYPDGASVRLERD